MRNSDTTRLLKDRVRGPPENGPSGARSSTRWTRLWHTLGWRPGGVKNHAEFRYNETLERAHEVPRKTALPKPDRRRQKGTSRRPLHHSPLRTLPYHGLHWAPANTEPISSEKKNVDKNILGTFLDVFGQRFGTRCVPRKRLENVLKAFKQGFGGSRVRQATPKLSFKCV
jgi:hypothetical protein